MDTTPLPAAPMHDFDKIVHVLMFLGLSGIVFFDSTRYLRFPVSKMRIFFSIFLFPIVIGGLIEIIQEYFTPSRNGDWFDFLFDVIGVILGWGIALLINRYLQFKKKFH
jgi:VanZ family protein